MGLLLLHRSLESVYSNLCFRKFIYADIAIYYGLECANGYPVWDSTVIHTPAVQHDSLESR